MFGAANGKRSWMIDDRELWACANEILRVHGSQAALHVATRIGALALAGDTAGIAVWKEIARRIDEMAARPNRTVN